MRTFIAIEIPEPLKQNLDLSIGVLRSNLEDGLIRWVRLEAMHLTLKFLGEIELEQVRTIQEILEETAAMFSSFDIVIAGFGCFPKSSRPRVVWAGIEPKNGELLALQTELETRMESIGFERERRDYHPHLTLGRVRKGLSGNDMKLISKWAQASQIGEVGRFEAKTINLIQSVLLPEGASYANLHVAGLAQ
jgi:2'-5' RNA ligase